MNKKGIAISSIIYTILILFLALIVGILGLLANRKLILDKNKNAVMNKLNNIEVSDDIVDINVTPEDSCFTYESNDTGITITSYTCGASSSDLSDGKYLDIIIPSTINGQTVTQIGDNAFDTEENEYAYISSVIIPDSVTTIGLCAFYDNSLASVTIPDSVTTIGNTAFYSNQLTSITIPKSVTTIGQFSFNDNQLPDSQAFIYQRNSDGSIDYTTLVSYGGAKRDNVVIPSSVTTIGAFAFSRTQLTSVTIPSSVTTIGDDAFLSNQLTSVIIPNSVTIIGQWAFRNNQLTSVSIPNSVTTIGSEAFYNNPDMTITIDNTSGAISGSPWGASSTSTITYLR